MKGNRWDDHYARRARDEKWLARSVYKLEEIDKKFRLIKRGDRLLDLGCYPGSWSQYGIKKVGKEGKVFGVDIFRPDRVLSSNFEFIQGDIFSLEIGALMDKMGPLNVVMSDMAPQTTGIRITDVSRSMDLAGRAEEIALALLKKRGHFLCKIFEGADLKEFESKVSQHFESVKLFRSKAIRKHSKEVYLLGLGFK